MTRMRAGRRIVVGVDGTAASAAAVRWAVREARLRHATVHIVAARRGDRGLHAPYAPWSGVPDQAEGDAADDASLTAVAEPARRHLPPGRWTAELADKPLARALLDRTAGAEMLVLGTTRLDSQAGGEPPDAIGPVARACLHRAHCPIVIVAAHPAGVPRAPRGGTHCGRRRLVDRSGQPAPPGSGSSRSAARAG